MTEHELVSVGKKQKNPSHIKVLTWPLDRRERTVMVKCIFSDISAINYCITANKKYSDKVLKCEDMLILNLTKKSSEPSKSQ